MNFMMGRYGPDKFSIVLLWSYCILAFLGIFLPILRLLNLAFMVYIIFRMFSRNIVARQRENERFLKFWNPIEAKFKKMITKMKDRDHRFFDCPNCKATLRLPKGKGKISITCPKCGKEFIRRT